MKVLKIAFGIYAAIVFLITLLCVFPLFFLVFLLFSEKKSPVIAHNISRFWALILFRSFFIRYTIVNSNFISKKETYVFVANHRSMLDIPLYARACSNTFRFLSKAELTKIPLLGYVIKNLYVTVKRGDKKDRQKSIEAMRKTLESDISIFICPEGTRNFTNQLLLPFKDGAFRLAIATQTPLAVLTVINTDVLLSPESPIALSPGKLIAEWSKPIDTTGMTENDVESLKQQTATLMKEILSRHLMTTQKQL